MRLTRLFGLSMLVLPALALAQQGTADDPFDAELAAETPTEWLEVDPPHFPRPAVPEPTPVKRPEQVPLERADLAPYFAEGKLREARQAFAQGAYTRCREKLDDVKDTPPVRFLRALAAFRMRDFAFAAAEFEVLADEYPALRDRCLLHAGWAAEGLQDFAQAQRSFEQIAPASRLFPDGQLGLSRALRNLGQGRIAAELLTQVGSRPAPPWGRDVGAEALLALVELQQARKDLTGEQHALNELWSKHPISSQAHKIEARFTNTTRLPVEVKVTRAEQLIEFHRNAQGLALVDPLLADLKLPDPLACRAHFAAGKAHRKLRAHPKAVNALLPVVKKCRDDELRARALFTLGFSQTVVAPQTAIETYEALARDYPTSPLSDDALFYAAEVRLRADDREGAADRLAELADRFPLSDMGADGLFKLFWQRWTAAALDDALAVLDEIEARFGHQEESHELERAHYWKARVLERKDDKDAAVELLATNAARHPATYYGLLSRERAELLAPARAKAIQRSVSATTGTAEVFPLSPGPMVDDLQFRSAVELLRLGFGELVPMEILGIDRANLPTEALRLLVVMLSLAGEERPAHGMARLWLRGDLSGPITERTRLVWEIAYPKAFRDLVEPAAVEADELDPDLLQALMREESALDPKALSWAGALGLCQLMPYTAAEVAAQLKLPRPTTAALLEPELNITLGARYLSGLVTRFSGVKPFAIASYNAGPGAVGRWRKEIESDDLAAWVEQIPIQETRNYVKRVLRSYNTYKLLYAPKDLAKTVAPLADKKVKKAEKKAAAPTPTHGAPTKGRKVLQEFRPRFVLPSR